MFSGTPWATAKVLQTSVRSIINNNIQKDKFILSDYKRERERERILKLTVTVMNGNKYDKQIEQGQIKVQYAYMLPSCLDVKGLYIYVYIYIQHIMYKYIRCIYTKFGPLTLSKMRSFNLHTIHTTHNPYSHSTYTQFTQHTILSRIQLTHNSHNKKTLLFIPHTQQSTNIPSYIYSSSLLLYNTYILAISWLHIFS